MRRNFSTLKSRDRIQAILDYWFTTNYDRHTNLPSPLIKKWFTPSVTVDNEIRS